MNARGCDRCSFRASLRGGGVAELRSPGSDHDAVLLDGSNLLPFHVDVGADRAEEGLEDPRSLDVGAVEAETRSECRTADDEAPDPQRRSEGPLRRPVLDHPDVVDVADRRSVGISDLRIEELTQPHAAL